MSSVLITGAGGQLGRLVVESLSTPDPAPQNSPQTRRPEALVDLTGRPQTTLRAFLGGRRGN
jgi:hypothetical protein